MRSTTIPALTLSAVLAGATAVTAVTASGQNATYASASPYPPAHAHKLLTDSKAMVYEKRSRETGNEAIWGCIRGELRPYLLGEEFSCEGGSDASCSGINREVLAGTMIAYEEGASSFLGERVLGNEHIIAVRNLDTGHVIHRAPTGELASPRKGFEGVGATTAIAVKPDGAVAWIADNAERSTATAEYFEVHAIDAHGNHVLAADTAIAPHSLRLRRSTLSWTQDGKRCSTTLN